MAIVYRRWDIVPVKRYSWEDDDSVPDWFPQKEPPLHDASREVSTARNVPKSLPGRKEPKDDDSEQGLS